VCTRVVNLTMRALVQLLGFYSHIHSKRVAYLTHVGTETPPICRRRPANEHAQSYLTLRSVQHYNEIHVK
jgi:hypothetical protein